MKRTSILFLALAALLVFAAGLAQARGGALDLSFGSNGMIAVPEVVDPEAMALQPNGDIVVLGMLCCGGGKTDFGFSLVKCAPSGVCTTIDDSWNYDAATSGVYDAVAVQPDNKVVVAGSAPDPSGNGGTEFAVARYNADGKLDASFGTGGFVTTKIGENAEADAVLVQPDGKIIAVGTKDPVGYWPPSGDPEFAVARYNGDGSLDPTFGQNGIETTSFGGSDYAHLAALQGDGKIVVGGFQGLVTDYGGLVQTPLVVRYDANGSLDTGFGHNGVFASIVQGGQVTALATESDGKVVFGSGVSNYFQANSTFLVGRLNANGSSDETFGYPYQSGWVATPVPGSVVGLSVLTNGEIVAGGSGGVVRYEPNGSLDYNFGELIHMDEVWPFGAGVISVATLPPGHALGPIALQPDGKIIALASGREGATTLARFLVGNSELLSVARHGRGLGQVFSNPPGIVCGRFETKARRPRARVCHSLFEGGSTVTLSVTHAERSHVSWGGACSGSLLSCNVTMSGHRKVVVTFTPKKR